MREYPRPLAVEGDMRRRRRPAGTQPKSDSASANPGVGTAGLERVRGFEDLPMISSFAWSADGEYIAAAGQRIYVRHTADGSPRYPEDRNKSEQASVTAWHPNHSTLAIGSDSGTVSLWDVSADSSHVIFRLEKPVVDIAWSPDGRKLALIDTTDRLGCPPSWKYCTRLTCGR